MIPMSIAARAAACATAVLAAVPAFAQRDDTLLQAATAEQPAVVRTLESLVNIETGADIATLTNGMTINTTTIGATKYNIRADVGTNMPTGSVRRASELVTTSGQKKLFQELMKLKMPSVASAGRAVGRAIRQ